VLPRDGRGGGFHHCQGGAGARSQLDVPGHRVQVAWPPRTGEKAMLR
jgi:hypothetical protein